MEGNKKVILHIMFDSPLFDGVYPLFEGMETYKNYYLLGTLDKGYKIRYIKNTEKLMYVASVNEWGKIVSDPKVDIIYFHGLWRDYLKAVDYIRQNVIVMWWCYGMDIYENCFRWPPLIPLKIFKPRTHWYCLKKMHGIMDYIDDVSYYNPRLYFIFIKIYDFLRGRRNKQILQMLSRIDYVYTQLDVEYVELKKRYPFFKAKQFKLMRPIVKEPFLIHTDTGSILLEHSGNISNNHLDIIAAIKKKKINLQERTIYIPWGYGVKGLDAKVQEDANFEGANVYLMKDFLPLMRYQEIVSSCTHAIYGMIRQSGLGNIYMCFRKGIKVFLFKDSVLYNFFKSQGYYVFSIEDDLNDKSIKEPLLPEQAKNNFDKSYIEYDSLLGTFQKQFDMILKGR